MRNTLAGAGSWLLVAVLLARAGDDKPQIFRGEIGDTQCALNVHSMTRSHTEMLKSKKMGGTPGACAIVGNTWEAILYCRRRMKSIVSTIRKECACSRARK